MNTATASLENDHIHILRLIDVMETITKTPKPNTGHLETIVSLIRTFADGLHHNKEENLLFPKMVEKGFSFEQGPVSVMLEDHEQGRYYVRGMADNIALYKAGDDEVVGNIYSNMRGYIELLRAHINKENNILFRMADKVLSNEDQQMLLNEFDKAEQNSGCFDSASSCLKQIENLVEIYSTKS